LVFERHRKVLNPGDFLVIDPDCASGWLDQPDGVSDLLVWIWRTGPRCWDLTVGPGKHRQWAIGRRLRQELENFHAQCRQEVERPDELTTLAIKQLHLAIDITVTRLVRQKTQPPEPSVRMELALRWMAQNLTEHNLTGALCDYLRVSPATLTRIFQKQHGESPSVHHQRLRVEKARELLKTDRLSVSEVASALGYKHPNDFNRAVRRFVGNSPRAVSRVGNHRRRRAS
jgi:AraC-like DNA-binding protein